MTDLIFPHPSDHARYRTLHRDDVEQIEPLLIEALKEGQLVHDFRQSKRCEPVAGRI